MGPRSSDRGYDLVEPVGQLRVLDASMGPRSSDRGYESTVGGGGPRLDQASMGPRSSDRGYAGAQCTGRPRPEASMGPRSSDRGYEGEVESIVAEAVAAMGPRSSDRGYGVSDGGVLVRPSTLQWVHGPQTVVMAKAHLVNAKLFGLQWVHGPQTVVMALEIDPIVDIQEPASMGPRSSDRGYALAAPGRGLAWSGLQWVHGPQTVVMRALGTPAGIALKASMGPRSSDRGYERNNSAKASSIHGFNGSTVLRPWLWRSAYPSDDDEMRLQWVHGPQTVVMIWYSDGNLYAEVLQWVHGPQTVVMFDIACKRIEGARRFNGSTVLRPWLWVSKSHSARTINELQWVHGPQTVVMFKNASAEHRLSRASMGPRSSDRGYAPSNRC